MMYTKDEKLGFFNLGTLFGIFFGILLSFLYSNLSFAYYNDGAVIFKVAEEETQRAVAEAISSKGDIIIYGYGPLENSNNIRDYIRQLNENREKDIQEFLKTRKLQVPTL